MADEPETQQPFEEEQAPESSAPEQPSEAAAAEQAAAPEQQPSEAAAAEQVAPSAEEAPVAEAPAEEAPAGAEAHPQASEPEEEKEQPVVPAPREKPAVPGAHLEVDIVPEGVDPLAREHPADPYAIEEYEEPQATEEDEEPDDAGELAQPISTAAIDLAAGARYRATGKRKTAIARVILKPGSGSYTINGRTLEEYFPRVTLQRNIRQPLETVGYEARMDVVARMHGSGISAQAGALRHGISRALLEADPNLRGELKRRGFLTRDSRAKERKKAGLKKARKRPQFSKR
jgi:small subunit ribosomal protein S9